MEARAIKHETTIVEDGQVPVPGVKAGEQVEVIVLRPAPSAQEELPLERFGGWLKGKIHIPPEFDDPIPGMEEYMTGPANP